MGVVRACVRACDRRCCRPMERRGRRGEGDEKRRGDDRGDIRGIRNNVMSALVQRGGEEQLVTRVLLYCGPNAVGRLRATHRAWSAIFGDGAIASSAYFSEMLKREYPHVERTSGGFMTFREIYTMHKSMGRLSGKCDVDRFSRRAPPRPP